MEWAKAKCPFPKLPEVEIAFFDGTLMCRIFGCYDHKEGAWYVNGEPFEQNGFKVTHWRTASNLPEPPKDN